MKIKLTRTTVLEYEPMKEHYPEGSTLEEMARMDSQSEDINFIFEENPNKTVEKVTYEIVESLENSES